MEIKFISYNFEDFLNLIFLMLGLILLLFAIEIMNYYFLLAAAGILVIGISPYFK